MKPNQKGPWKTDRYPIQSRAVMQPDGRIIYEKRIKPVKYLGPAARAKAKATCSKPKQKLPRKHKFKITHGYAVGDTRAGILVTVATRKPIRRRTPQRARDEARYRALVKDWLSKYIWCEFEGCINKPTECHHSHGRRGKLLLWTDGWFALCRHHHEYVHRNPDDARRRGLLCEAGRWNDQSIVP